MRLTHLIIDDFKKGTWIKTEQTSVEVHYFPVITVKLLWI